MSAYSYGRQDFVNLTLARISFDFFPKSGLCCWTVEPQKPRRSRWIEVRNPQLQDGLGRSRSRSARTHIAW